MTADEEAFTEFVAARTAALSRTAYLLTGNHHDAEDLVQTALFKAAKQWGRIRSEPEAYVRRILYTENISRWRKHGRRAMEYPTEQLADQAAAAAPDADTRVSLQRALDKLTPKQRTVLVLRYYEDLTEEQTAGAMGVRLGTVKSQTRHALMRIQQLSPELVDLATAGN